MGFSPFAEATKYAKKYTETKKAPTKAAPVAKPKSAKASPKMTADLKKINSNSQTLAPTVNRLVQNIPTPTRQYTASELETPQMKKYTQMLQMKNKLTDSFLTSQAGGQEWRDKNFEERVATQGMDVTMAEVGQRKDIMRKETLLNAAKQPMNLIRQANERDKWIMGNWTQDDKQLLYEQTGKLADTVKHMPMAEIRRLAPDFIKKKEIEYKKTQETSRFLGAVAKQLDQDLVKIYGHDKISQMEATAAFSPDRMVTSALEAASLDVIEFDMLNQMGRDVYYKNGKMFYKGFEIDDEYITAAGQDADKTAKIVSSIIGSLPTYAVGGAAIKAGIAGAQKLAKGQNLVKTAKFFGQIDKLAKTQSVWKSALAEATVFNVMEEGAEAMIRKGTGQEYTFSNFLNGLMWGATLGGSVNIGMKGAQKGLSIAGNFVESRQLTGQIAKAEQVFAKTGDFESIKSLPLGNSTFGMAFTESRFAYLKGLQNPDVRPGIEQAAPLPQSKPVEMTPLHEEAAAKKAATDSVEIRRLKTRGETMILEYVETSLKPTMKKGVEQGGISRDAEGNLLKREGRISNNDKWYSDFYTKEKRAPNNADLKVIAIDHLSKGHTDYSYDMPPNDEFVELVAQIRGGRAEAKMKSESGELPVVGATKIGKQIAKNAVSKRLMSTFEDTAEYDKIKLDDQARMASDLVFGDIDFVMDVVLGKQELPSNLRAVALISALEDYAVRMGDGKVLQALANSKLVSDTSIYAQEMRLMAERAPESPVAAMHRIRKAREEAAIRKETKEVGKYFKNSIKELDRDLKKMEKAGEKKLADAIRAEQKELKSELKKAARVKSVDQLKRIVVTQIKREITKTAPTIKEWGDLVDSLTC